MRKLFVIITLCYLSFFNFGCKKSSEIEYLDFITNITINEIFEMEEDTYYIYFYKNDCEYCDNLKDVLYEVSYKGDVKIYGVNFSDEKNKLINRAYTNGEGSNFKYYVTGCTNYNELYINGNPSLIKIENKVSYFIANGYRNTNAYLMDILEIENE